MESKMIPKVPTFCSTQHWPIYVVSWLEFLNLQSRDDVGHDKMCWVELAVISSCPLAECGSFSHIVPYIYLYVSTV